MVYSTTVSEGTGTTAEAPPKWSARNVCSRTSRRGEGFCNGELLPRQRATGRPKPGGGDPGRREHGVGDHEERRYARSTVRYGPHRPSVVDNFRRREHGGVRDERDREGGR